MPKIKVQDINLYYEVHGEGFPLVLIRGLGSNADHWYAQVLAFSPHYRVICFDNRGIGRSDRPEGPYTISMMADDTAGLMDALGISRAHILGISMGGMIAQVLALKYPQRIHGLVLACTHCGGDHAVSASEEVIAIFADYLQTGTQEAGEKALTCLFAEKTLKEAPQVAAHYQEVSARFPPATEVLMNQLMAVRGHDCWEDLSRLQAPTLVMAGTADVLVPPKNAEILAEQIPGSQLLFIEGGGHQFLVEQADAFNEAVLQFLKNLV